MRKTTLAITTAALLLAAQAGADSAPAAPQTYQVKVDADVVYPDGTSASLVRGKEIEIEGFTCIVEENAPPAGGTHWGLAIKCESSEGMFGVAARCDTTVPGEENMSTMSLQEKGGEGVMTRLVIQCETTYARTPKPKTAPAKPKGA